MEHLLRVFKVLSDETRFRIIVLLKQQRLCVFEICEILELSQSKVSKHLAKLKDLNFVFGERKEQYVCYNLRLVDPILCNLIDEIITSIDKYPQLSIDSERLMKRENILHINKNDI